MIDFASVAVGVVSVLSPYLPRLLSLGKGVGEKIGESIVEKGVDTAGGQVGKLWAKISSYFKEDVEVSSAATLVAADPGDTVRQQMLGQVLADRLKERPELAGELIEIMGGQRGLQQIVANNEATIKAIRMKMTRAGEQSIEAGDRAIIEGVEMDMGD